MDPLGPLYELIQDAYPDDTPAAINEWLDLFENMGATPTLALYAADKESLNGNH